MQTLYTATLSAAIESLGLFFEDDRSFLTENSSRTRWTGQ